MSEADLQKLKVTELKELLSKHDLPQTGKKDDLVKRLLDAGIAPQGEEEELVAPEARESAPAETAPTESAPAPEASSTTENTLTPEQQAMKSRAERFGIAFNPNPTSTASKPKATASASASTAKPATTSAAPVEKKEKIGAIDKAPLGISDEVLAKRAAKFGLPEKKEEKSTPVAATKTKAAEPEKPKVEEMTPEMKEKLAVEEEKKRKRAEKFGTAKPANGEESDAKKVKV